MIHTTKDGTEIKLSDMSNSHLKATMRILEQMAEEGYTVRRGGGTTAENIWYDEETYFGEDALEYLDYYEYKKELEKR